MQISFVKKTKKSKIHRVNLDFDKDEQMTLAEANKLKEELKLIFLKK